MIEKNCKIYVAGHRGLVGSALVRALRRAGYNNLLLRCHSELELLDKTAVDEFFELEKPEFVFLAAARVGGIHANDSYPVAFIYENLMIQSHVMHAAWQSGVRKLIFLGSSCIYPRLAPQPMREEHLLTGPLEPTNSSYAVAKIAGIEMCRAYNRQYGTSFIPVMPTNLYGPGDNYDLLDSHVLPALIRKFHLAKLAASGDEDGIERDAACYGPIPDDFYNNLRRIARAAGHALAGAGVSRPAGLPAEPGSPGDAVELWGSGRPKREFLYVDDLAEAVLFIIENYREKELINIGCGTDLTIAELAETVRRVVGFSGTVYFNPEKPDGMPRKLLDVTKLFRLGWSPRVDLEEGIGRAYEAYRRRLEEGDGKR